MRTITDNTAEALFLLDRTGHVTFMNPAAERMFGWSREELLGRVLHDATHHNDPDGRPYPLSDCALRSVFTSAEPLTEHEDVFFYRDGSEIDLISSAVRRVGQACVGTFRSRRSPNH